MERRCFLQSLAAAHAAGMVFAQQRGPMPPVEPFKPSEAPNSPIGEAKGIHPGRVVWVRDAKAASWDGKTGFWWDDANTDQRVVDRMTSRLLLDLTGQKNEKQAWDALFRHFNETHKRGNSGYRRGERIAIKINGNQDRGPDWTNMVRSFPGGRGPGGGAPAGGPLPGGMPPGGGLPPGGPAVEGGRGGGPPRGPQNGLASPHVISALVSQLINVAGVAGEDIMIYEALDNHNVGQPIFTKIRSNSGRDFQAVKFLAGNDFGHGGRINPTVDKANPVRFSKEGVPTAYIPREVVESTYLINLALLRAHTMAGVTLIGKNHFGSVHFPDRGWTPSPLHPYVQRTLPMGSYNVLVDLMGHQHLGGKTMLYMLDGIYSSEHNEGNAYRWASFGDHWASSMLMSQDPVALDSVGLDILRNEPRATEVRGSADNYMHEAALAAKPPSGTVYNPDGRGAFSSLGVHEHWNNSTDRKYSRNLGSKQGIELIALV
ncbi:MAG: DUF362 domain-containing protein [Bryobacteraceae bacterium]